MSSKTSYALGRALSAERTLSRELREYAGPFGSRDSRRYVKSMVRRSRRTIDRQVIREALEHASLESFDDVA